MKLKNTIAKILAVLSLAAFAHFPAAAQTGPERDGTGFHIGAGPAYVSISDWCDIPEDPGDSCDDTAIGLKVFGNYRVHKNFGVEGGWLWANGFDYNYPGFISGDATSSAFYVAGEAGHTFKSGVGVFAKAGVNFWDVELDCGAGCSGDIDGTDPLFGLVAEYRNTPVSPLKVRAEWMRLLQEEDGSDNDTDVFSFTAGYIF